MRIVLAKMPGSVFNRSIWEGLARAFRFLDHEVVEVDDRSLPDPTSFDPMPDFLFAVHGSEIPLDVLTRYRDRTIPTAVYLLDEPYECDRSTAWARHFEWVFSVDRVTVDLHRRHSEAAFLPLGYDSERFSPEGKSYPSDILVLGSPFARRLELLAPLRRRFGRRITWVGPGWRPFCPEGKHVEDYVSPDVCARFYRGARIIINIHRDPYWSHFGQTNSRGLPATHLNPRFWEAAACGGFQLCSYRSDAELFAPSSPTFRDGFELLEALARYDSAEAERAERAEKTRALIAAHDYRARARDVLSFLTRGVKSCPSPSIEDSDAGITASQRSVPSRASAWRPS